MGITGLGSEYFNKVIDGIIGIHELLNRQFKENDMELWQPSVHEDMPAINVNNRYFTPKRDCPCVQPVPFLPMVDPKGVLSSLANNSSDFIHTNENQVHYFEHVADSTGIKGLVYRLKHIIHLWLINFIQA